jgi:hypothetical protein
MNESHLDPLRDRLCRRAFLGAGARGLMGLSMASFLGRVALADDAPAYALPQSSAKRVIQIFLSGGLSQIDLFDEKPLLSKHRGEELPESVRRGQRITGLTEKQGALPVAASCFKFRDYGKSGMRMAEILPELGSIADELTLVRSLQTDHVLHEAAMTILFTGTQLLGRPSFGAWVSYALGTLNENIPEFVVLLSGGKGGTPLHPRLWHNGFLPGRHQGVQFRSGGDPVLFASNPPGIDTKARRSVLDAIAALNELEQRSVGDPDITTRTQAYEMAARMQTSVPELADLSKEPQDVLDAYGATPGKESFANNCLLARRLVERGVRFVQICDGGWDTHFEIPTVLPKKCQDVDKPTAALIKDLKERGLLEDTIVMFTGEFGRTSYCEGPLSFDSYGRDHQALCNSVLLAGGGFKRGFTYGKTDDWGWDVVEQPVHMHDLHATLLHCLGLDHEKLTFRHQSRDFRLTDVAGRVVNDVLV